MCFVTGFPNQTQAAVQVVLLHPPQEQVNTCISLTGTHVYQKRVLLTKYKP